MRSEFEKVMRKSRGAKRSALLFFRVARNSNHACPPLSLPLTFSLFSFLFLLLGVLLVSSFVFRTCQFSFRQSPSSSLLLSQRNCYFPFSSTFTNEPIKLQLSVTDPRSTLNFIRFFFCVLYFTSYRHIITNNT